jgi:hypothetical protein
LGRDGSILIISFTSQLSEMSRTITVAAAQVGAVHKTTPRSEVLARLIALLEQASDKGVKVLVYP